ncbi:TonB family protein [Rapidithrix thailandica]|uniref:TonB family protein n=1 Tax=Rapidithrix thailandica TaxID=413964 RepID=A0AAW9SFW0_9BACT
MSNSTFHTDPEITAEMLKKYLEGTLSPAEMYRVERAVMRDPFLQDALEGMEEFENTEVFAQDVEGLKASLAQKTQTNKRHRFVPQYRWLGSAAAVLILIFVGYFALRPPQEEAPSELAYEAPKPTTQPKTQNKPGVSETAPMGKAKEDSQELSPAVAAPTVKAPSPTVKSSPSALPVPTPTDDTEEIELMELDIMDEEIALQEEEALEEFVADPTIQDYEQDTLLQDTLTPKANTTLNALSGKSSGINITQRAKKKQETEHLINISGTIKGANDEAALPGVNVLVKGTAIGTNTDIEGKYTLQVPQNLRQNPLVFSCIGYQTLEIPQASRTVIDVQLEPELMALEEVVVTKGQKEEKSHSTSTAAKPSGGFNGYKRYLKAHLRYPEEALKEKVEGIVKVRFTVLPDGNISDAKIHSGLGYGCDEEALRLIEEGPSWIPAQEGGQSVSQEVTLRVRFKLPR